MNERLIVGLGNPGREYEKTRHNAGFLLIDRLVEKLRAREAASSRHALLWSAVHNEATVWLMKPLTYMNLSGLAVQAFLEQRPLPLENLLTAFDDIALPPGKIRVRPSGSAGGQKGIRHIMETLESDEIPRLRIGIGSEARRGPLADFVLSEFDEDELPLVHGALDLSVDAALMWLNHDIETVMGRFNALAVNVSNQ